MHNEETTAAYPTVRLFRDKVIFYPTGSRFEDTVQSHPIGWYFEGTVQSSNRKVNLKILCSFIL
uniref:Uncharacterized protein n=1 Tax=Anguilla anguilla TaxID=7936 RepID=A0A0E9PZU2_ANGAN